MKILILERLNEVEHVLATFVRERFPQAEIVFIGNVDRKEPEEIIAAILEADILCAQSIFDDTTAFEGVIKLYTALKIQKPVYLIHTTQNLLHALNFRIKEASSQALAKLLEGGLEVYNVYYHLFDNPKNDPTAFFSCPDIVKFDVIKLYYNKKTDVIWDEHLHFIPHSTHTFFKKKAYFLEREPFDISPKDLTLLKEILSEVYVDLEEKSEDLEHSRFFDETERNEIKATNKKRLALLDKLKVHPYK